MFIWTLLYEVRLADESEVTLKRLRPKTIMNATKQKLVLKLRIKIASNVYCNLYRRGLYSVRWACLANYVVGS